MSDTAELVLQALREKGPLRTRDIRDELDRLGSDRHRLDLHAAMQRLQRLNLIQRASAPLFEREAPFQLVEKAKGNLMISAEQRAKETVSDFHARLPASYAIWGKGRRDRLQAAITTVILEAENAKLEEAAAKIGAECEVYGQRLEMSDLEAEVFGSPDGVKKVIKQVQGALEGIPESIRSLISKKD